MEPCKVTVSGTMVKDKNMLGCGKTIKPTDKASILPNKATFRVLSNISQEISASL